MASPQLETTVFSRGPHRGRTLRQWVAISESGSRLVTLRLEHDGARWNVVGCAFGASELDDEFPSDASPSQPPSLERLHRVLQNWETVVSLARAAIGWDREAEVKHTEALRKSAKQGTNLGAAFYKGIADEYRKALERGQRPTAAIVREHGVSRSTASRWLVNARARGYLGPATPRKAGEQKEASNAS